MNGPLVTTARQETTRRYREKNREKLRVWNRDYAARRRREAGMPALGTPESTENRKRARKLHGLEHPNWKGDEVGYAALHTWVAQHRTKTGICSDCGVRPTTRTEWANVSGEYRRDLDDYVEVCVPCHISRDGPRNPKGVSGHR